MYILRNIHLEYIYHIVMNILVVPYTATTVSIIARFIFMYLLYTKKSTNNLSLTFCILNVCSSSLWIYYSAYYGDTPLIVRSSSELILLSISAVYIIRNKVISQNGQMVIPEQIQIVDIRA
jgi:uncharacterized protein with PQ loop repeat